MTAKWFLNNYDKFNFSKRDVENLLEGTTYPINLKYHNNQLEAVKRFHIVNNNLRLTPYQTTIGDLVYCEGDDNCSRWLDLLENVHEFLKDCTLKSGLVRKFYPKENEVDFYKKMSNYYRHNLSLLYRYLSNEKGELNYQPAKDPFSSCLSTDHFEKKLTKIFRECGYNDISYDIEKFKKVLELDIETMAHDWRKIRENDYQELNITTYRFLLDVAIWRRNNANTTIEDWRNFLNLIYRNFKTEVQYKYVNDENQRIKIPTIISEETDEHIEVSWDEAISRASSELNNIKGEILFIASAFSTLEDNYTLKKFAKEIFKSNNIVYIPNIDDTFADELLKKADKTPNANGLKLLGINPVTEKHIEDLKEGKYKIIYLINNDISHIPEANKLLKKVDISIFHLNTRNNYSDKATVIFPESSYAEINGTFVNFQNRVQRIKPAVVTLEQERLIGEYSISRLDKFGAPNDSWSHGTRYNARPTWKVLTKIAKSLGHDFNFENSEDVFIELCNSIPGMKGWNYDTIGSKGKTV